MEKAKLAFYIEFGTDSARREKYKKALKNPNKSLADYKELAAEFMPETNPVINIEFQTMREFYKYSDNFINDCLKSIKRDCHPQLERLYKIIDNRYVFLEWLHGTGLYFADGKNEDGTPIYLDWWERIRNVKMGGIKADEKLLRDYAHKMDKKIVMRQTIGKIASVSVYENRVKTEFVDDYTNLIYTLTDNQARKADELLIRDSNGEIVKELKSELLNDYALIKAKREMRLKNRKNKVENISEPQLKEQEAPENISERPQKTSAIFNDVKDMDFNRSEVIEDSNGNRWAKCEICSEIKPTIEFWSYGGLGTENLGQCKVCGKLVTLVRE
jgi:hypothetical protein